MRIAHYDRFEKLRRLVAAPKVREAQEEDLLGRKLLQSRKLGLRPVLGQVDVVSSESLA